MPALLPSLLHPKNAPAPWPARGTLPQGQRVYAVGDIHGRADLLHNLLEKIAADVAGYRGKITRVFLGDYIDRGPDSAGVVEQLLCLGTRHDCVFLKGNHEWAMSEFLAAPLQRAEWLHWGGDTALHSYGIPVFDAYHRLRPLPALAAELKHTLAARGHADFFKHLGLWHRLGGYAFVHAGMRRGLPLEDQLEHDLLFLRAHAWASGHELPLRIVHGHNITSKPEIHDDRIGIDTGAYHSGMLTCAVLEEGGVRFLDTGSSAT